MASGWRGASSDRRYRRSSTPLLAQALGALSDLTSVSGRAYVIVNYTATASSRCTTTSAVTTSTTTATKALSCPNAGVTQAELGLTYPLAEFYYLLRGPTYVSCIYTPVAPTVNCPDGDGSFVNGASGECELVEVSELTGASGPLNTSTFCASHAPCKSEGPLPPTPSTGELPTKRWARDRRGRHLHRCS